MNEVAEIVYNPLAFKDSIFGVDPTGLVVKRFLNLDLFGSLVPQLHRQLYVSQFYLLNIVDKLLIFSVKLLRGYFLLLF